MKQFTTVSAVCLMALIGSVVGMPVKADDWNRKSVISFSAPVEIPGVHLAGWGVLPAGTYVFKIVDSQSDRHVVQISNKEENIVYATVLAIPNYRLQATDKTVMTFSERAAGEPEALRAWFYPGRNWGEEFVYPKMKAIALAKAANTHVLFTPAEMPMEVTEPIKAVDAPVIGELKKMPIMAIKPSGEEVQVSEVVTAPPAEQPAPVVAQQPAPVVTPAAQVETATLPSTASSLSTLALFGLLALGGALTLRAPYRRNR